MLQIILMCQIFSGVYSPHALEKFFTYITYQKSKLYLGQLAYTQYTKHVQQSCLYDLRL
jgi:hypothetical protein